MKSITNMSLNTIMSTALLTALLGGCQTLPYQGQARDVKRRPDGGVIAMKIDFRPEDRAVAEQKMRANCRSQDLHIESEEEVVVGQKTDSNSRDTNREANKSQVGSLFGIPLVSGDDGGKDTASSSTTTQIKEWQIVYKCASAPTSASKVK
jgi:hypothetical protein